MVQFTTMIQEEVRDGDAYGVFDFIAQAVDLGVPSQETPKPSWRGHGPMGHMARHPRRPPMEAEWRRFNEDGPLSKWNDHRYLRERFPKHTARRLSMAEA